MRWLRKIFAAPPCDHVWVDAMRGESEIGAKLNGTWYERSRTLTFKECVRCRDACPPHFYGPWSEWTLMQHYYGY